MNPHRSSLYYVNMTGIRVGKKVVPIPAPALAFNPATGAGTVLDSGTMFTRLVAPAYMVVRDEVRRRVGAPVSSLGGFDTCFNTTAVAWPPVTLLFDGMQVMLPEENVVIHSTYGTISCLTMAAAPDGVDTVLNGLDARPPRPRHRAQHLRGETRGPGWNRAMPRSRIRRRRRAHGWRTRRTQHNAIKWNERIFGAALNCRSFSGLEARVQRHADITVRTPAFAETCTACRNVRPGAYEPNY